MSVKLGHQRLALLSLVNATMANGCQCNKDSGHIKVPMKSQVLGKFMTLCR